MKPDKSSSTVVYAQKPRLKMALKNSITLCTVLYDKDMWMKQIYAVVCDKSILSRAQKHMKILMATYSHNHLQDSNISDIVGHRKGT